MKHKLLIILLIALPLTAAWADCVYDPVCYSSFGTVSTTEPDGDCQVTLTATPFTGYTFKYWEDDHSNTNPVRTVTLPEYSDNDGHAYAWTAVFEKQIRSCWDQTNYDYIINSSRGRLTLTYDEENEHYVLTASSYDGFDFVRWSDGLTEPVRYVTITDADSLAMTSFAFTAEFTKTVSHCWDCTHYDPVTADAHGSIRYARGGECEYILTAVPDEGYVFARWADDATQIDNPRSVSITESELSETQIAYTAVFVRPGDTQVDAYAPTGISAISLSRDLTDGTADIYDSDGTRLASSEVSGSNGEWTFATPALASRQGEELHIVYTNACDEICDVTDVVVPVLVSTVTPLSELSLPADMSGTGIHVLQGGALTFDNDLALSELDIYAGGKAVVPSGRMVSVSSVTMRGDGINNRFPQLVVNGSLNNTNSDTIYYDYALDYHAYYPLAVPYTVDHTAIRTRSGKTASFEIGEYDGDRRATGASGWGGVFDDTSNDIPSGEGFTIFAVPRKWNGVRQSQAVVRLPMVADLSEGEQQKTNVAVYAYGDENTLDNDRNWNFIGNPYLADFTNLGTDLMSDDGLNISVGMFEKTLVDGSWNGHWHYTGDLRYVTIPSNGFTEYAQERVTTALLRSFNSFFVQAAAEGYLRFEIGHRAQNAPGRKNAAQDAQTNEELLAGITLRQGNSTDHAGLLIGSGFTYRYDYNADLVKLFGSNQGLSVYMLGCADAQNSAAQMPCAYLALPTAGQNATAAGTNIHEQVIPVGYRGAKSEDMTFGYDDERYTTTATDDDARITALLLKDNLTGAVTDLLTASYTCRAITRSDDTRFTLTVRYTYPETDGLADITTGNSIVTATVADDSPTSGSARTVLYDVLGRRIADGEKAANLPAGVYIEVGNGDARKEVVR